MPLSVVSKYKIATAALLVVTTSLLVFIAISFYQKQHDKENERHLTLHGLEGGDVYYVDIYNLKVTTKVNTDTFTFKNFTELSVWLEDMTKSQYYQWLAFEVNRAISSGTATLLPNKEGVFISAPIHRTNEVARVYLRGTTDNNTYTLARKDWIFSNAKTFADYALPINQKYRKEFPKKRE